MCVWYSIFAGWWFQTCFILTPTWGNLQFFKWVETTKYIVCIYPPVIYRGWKLPLFQIENTSSKGPCVVAVFEFPEGMYVCLYLYRQYISYVYMQRCCSCLGVAIITLVQVKLQCGYFLLVPLGSHPPPAHVFQDFSSQHPYTFAILCLEVWNLTKKCWIEPITLKVNQHTVCTLCNRKGHLLTKVGRSRQKYHGFPPKPTLHLSIHFLPSFLDLVDQQHPECRLDGAFRGVLSGVCLEGRLDIQSENALKKVVK